MSDPFAARVLVALFESDLSLGAVYAAPGDEFDADLGAVRILLGGELGEDPVSLGGYQAAPIQARTRFEIRAIDAGLQSAAPVEGGRFQIDAGSNIFPGEIYRIDGAPMRLDPARLVWSCYVSKVVE